MAGVIGVLQKYFRPYGRYALIAFLIVLFLSIAVYAYFKYAKPSIEKLTMQSDIANLDEREKTAEIYFFHVDWCPHCVKAQPIWDSFSSKMNGATINGYTIKCIDINCTDDKDSSVQDTITNFNIDSYPTVKMIKDNDQILFDSKISSESLEKFVNTVLN